MHTTVADSDLQIRGWGEGGGHPDPEMRASVCSKNKGGARAPPLDPPLYKTLVRPQIEYASTRLWDSFTQENQNKIEMLQRRAARFACNN